MIVKAVKTKRVVAGDDLYGLIAKYVPELGEHSILVVTSKIISLCEGRVVAKDNADSKKLIKDEADFVLPPEFDRQLQLTITRNTLIPASGIDRSNSSGDYVLWPSDPQKSANQIRTYLKNHYGLKEVGVLVTDSGAMPLRFGTIGVPIAFSGFAAQNDYTGQKDLFGFPLWAGKSNIAGGLAAAAVAVMGEGAEQTPLAVISEVDFVQFQDSDPSQEEIDGFSIPYTKEGLFAPFFDSINWQPGGRQKRG